MAFPVLNEPVEDKKKIKKEVTQTISNSINKISYYSHSFLDGLVLLTIAFLYFFFTGLAILLKKPLPKEWMALAKDLNKGKVARKIKGMPLEDKPGIKKRFKIVDLETAKELPFPTDNGSKP